jgi:predicted O-linked N-acetylglucosamine transferase (SPINDLY family)
MNRKQRRVAKSQGKAGSRQPAQTGSAGSSAPIAELFGAAISHHQAGRLVDAERLYRQICAIDNEHVDSLHGLGLLAGQVGRNDVAIDLIGRAVALRPDYVEAHYNLGVLLAKENRLDQAAAHYRRVLALRPDLAEAHNSLGTVLSDQGRPAEALACFGRAVALRPDFAEAHFNQGIALKKAGNPVDALNCYDKALALKPDYVEAYNNRGNVLKDLKRPAEALASFEATLTIAPDHPYAFGAMADAALACCDWRRTAVIAEELKSRIERGTSIVSPFTLLGYSGDPPLQLECARRFVADKLPGRPPPLWTGAISHHDKLRIAYLSAAYNLHPRAFLMVQLVELHDRARFEVVGISLGRDDQSDIRARLVRSFDQFHDVQSMSDLDVAKLLNDLQIDIAVDLNGHTQGARIGVLAHRPAPIQVSYLGYPGSTGADFIDYVIADKMALPLDQQPFFTERIVHLPDSYQVTDSKREIAARTPTRREVELPDEGFVFCCFNNNYKITPPVFEVWMRLLGTIEGSVLWLLQDNRDAEASLRRAAAERGVDPARLVFANRLSQEEHLARHRLADLFLDTLPYNAHTTASDALWAGLPVLTCRGSSFAARVAASLLHAAGLPELVTDDLPAYEALALRLAADASLLQGFQRRLEENRTSCPLFDTDRFCRHIESAYATMWDLRRRGEPPRSFSVA